MKTTVHSFLSFLVAASGVWADSIPSIPRRIPPPGIEIPAEVRDRLEARMKKANVIAARFRDDPDVAVFRKAVRFALANGEFYDEKHFEIADKLLDEAESRSASLVAGEIPWARSKGLVVRGFRSDIDDSFQPYGLEIPPKLRLNRPVPLYVWLHGRGDKTTDLHFIHQRMQKAGPFPIEDGIVLHPFGRQCIGFKSAGETDVIEAIEKVRSQYRIDKQRIALMGFSMGGAGAWHLGARYADKWAVVHAGAGFAETARYNRLAKANYPPWYEQRLWGLHDAPGYVRNLFNFPVIAYSGEVDKQKQAADVMAEAFASHDQELPHVVGPKMGHKYDETSKKKILAFVRKAFEYGREAQPQTVHLQTRTLRYNRVRWIYVSGLMEHWKDSRVDAHFESEASTLVATTKNVSSLLLMHPNPDCCGGRNGFSLTIDGVEIQVPPNLFSVPLLRKPGGPWTVGSPPEGLRKKRGLQGPIDDAFLSRFLVVAPESSSGNKAIDQWITFELAHLQKRWRELFRGDLPLKKAKSVTEDEAKSRHLVLFGTPENNPFIAKVASELPVTWKGDSVVAGKRSYPAANHLPLLIYPNPLSPEKYVVLNTGPTFREAHDRTNSLQNPKLPDWAILDITQPPNGEAAGKVVAADFLDERWQLKPVGDD